MTFCHARNYTDLYYNRLFFPCQGFFSRVAKFFNKYPICNILEAYLYGIGFFTLDKLQAKTKF